MEIEFMLLKDNYTAKEVQRIIMKAYNLGINKEKISVFQ